MNRRAFIAGSLATLARAAGLRCPNFGNTAPDWRNQRGGGTYRTDVSKPHSRPEVPAESVVTLPEGRCATCGELYQPRRRDQRFCSLRCRVRGYAGEQAREARDGAEAARRLAVLLERRAERWSKVAEGRR